MLCERCHQKYATIHMQQIVNGIKTEIHLCHECSSKTSTPVTMEALFNGLLGSFMHMANEKQPPQQMNIVQEPCQTCGMTNDDFKNAGGKLGCADCYKFFAQELESILKNVQASTHHEGKYPQKSGQGMFQKKKASRLRELMQEAIEKENFEEAARLRDEVRSIESTLTEEQ